MTKKVVLIIVEGNSEQELLNDYLEKYFSNQKIIFSVKHGDIFYSPYDRPPIKSLIGQIIEDEIRTHKYKRKDILAILHIADTDGCFIDNKNIVINPHQSEKTFYCLENIKVDSTKQKREIEKRNTQKLFNISKVFNVKEIVSKRYKYKLFYFSRNLEHVLFNEPNPKQETKVSHVEKFNSSLNEPLETYLSQFLPTLDNETDFDTQYKESWIFIRKSNNSLKRYTNVPLLFNFIQSLISEET